MRATGSREGGDRRGRDVLRGELGVRGQGHIAVAGTFLTGMWGHKTLSLAAAYVGVPAGVVGYVHSEGKSAITVLACVACVDLAHGWLLRFC